MYSTLIKEDYYEIGLDDRLQAVVLTYKRKGTSEEFRNLHFRLVEVFEKKRKSKLFVDTRKLGIVAPDDQRWVAQKVVPQMAMHAENQFLSIAVVTTKYVFTQMAVDNIEQLSIDTGTCLNKHFDNMAAATAWLQEQ